MSTTKTPSRRVRKDRRRPDLDTVYTINADGSRNFLHPADVHGVWQVRKNVVWFVLLAIYVATPWIPINGHPAVNFDIGARNAYLFGETFTNQDFYLLFFLVSGLGFGLFVVTSLWGRIWCGYACPQTVFMEAVFRRVERWIEGPRERRIRRNLGPNNWDKVWRKGLKHALFVALAWLTAHAFLAYFFPPHELAEAVLGPPGEHWAAFLWGTIWTGVLYFNYAWFREQTCLIICPYGRAQSALVDRNTVVIGYDERRGEPRSKKRATAASLEAAEAKAAEGDGPIALPAAGDCIDCFRCVSVCPTGIDIRNGLQMECIGCANCIDACDDIMERTGREPGLIRYDSLNGFEGEPKGSWARPRVFLYAVLGLLGLFVFGFTLSQREDFEVRMLRSRGLPYQLRETTIRNVYNVRIQNKTTETRTYELTARVVDGEGETITFTIAQPTVTLEGLADTRTPIVAEGPREGWSGSRPIEIVITEVESGHGRTLDATFRGP